MSSRKENSPKDPFPKTAIFDHKPETWERIRSDILSLTFSSGLLNPDNKVLGETDDVIIADDLETMLKQPTTVMSLLVDETQKTIGYSAAIPIGEMNPERTSENQDTAYVYFSVIDEKHRGKGYIAGLNDALLQELRNKGYKFVERDAQIGNGYADSITQAFGQSVLESYDHKKFPEVGPERFFRIDINRYFSLKK